MTRLLEVMIDESALFTRPKRPGVMAGQIRRLLDLDDSPHATVRVIPFEAPFWEQRGHNFDVLSFAGTTDRIGVSYWAVSGAELDTPQLHDLWARIEADCAAGPAESRAILERHLAAHS